jgi:hypothetical protein
MLGFWNTCKFCDKKFMVTKTSSPDKGLCSYACFVQAKPRGSSRKPPTVRASRAQEKRTAKDGGGRQVVASGALAGRKGDVKLPHRVRPLRHLPGWLVENKTTKGKSYRFVREDWQTHCVDAAMVGRKPVFEINISGEEFCVIPRSEFMNFIRQSG